MLTQYRKMTIESPFVTHLEETDGSGKAKSWHTLSMKSDQRLIHRPSLFASTFVMNAIKASYYSLLCSLMKCVDFQNVSRALVIDWSMCFCKISKGSFCSSSIVDCALFWMITLFMKRLVNLLVIKFSPIVSAHFSTFLNYSNFLLTIKLSIWPDSSFSESK